MDYQFVYMLQLFILLVPSVVFNRFASAIVDRDLILTPKEGLQINGKSIYYEEEPNDALRNQTKRPWERALKHLTYITLFTNGHEIANHNKSESQNYAEFLRSPYIGNANTNYARFGDIVTLATGRVEHTGNGTFLFVEGMCAYGCEAEQLRALWQVQKIRHRDEKHNFRYEMKFSISPLRNYNNNNNNNSNNGTTKRKADESTFWHAKRQHTFIQKEDDYPHSFSKLIMPQAERFFERKFDKQLQRRNMGYEQQPQQQQQVTPIPQSTFMHAIYQPHPALLPPIRPEMLNMGEYMRFKQPIKSSPKIEFFPSTFNMVNRQNLPSQMIPTSYRPNHQYALPKPAIYEKRHQNEFPIGSTIATPTMMHHYHHHFFIPNSAEDFNNNNNNKNYFVLESDEEYNNNNNNNHNNNLLNDPQPTAQPLIHTYTSNHPTSPVTHTITFPLSEEQKYEHTTEVHANIIELTQVTPPTATTPATVPYQHNHPIRKPINEHSNEQQYGFTTEEPFFIYAAPIDDAASQTSSVKDFVQSEPYDTPIRYSEPDPLYTNAPDNHQIQHHTNSNINNQIVQQIKAKNQQDSFTAQLPPPDRDEAVSLPYVADKFTENPNKHNDDSEQLSSQKKHQVNTAPAETTTIHQVQDTTIATTEQQITTTTPVSKTNTTSSTSALEKQFISTSTTETPLRSLSRFRLPKYSRSSSTTSTTEQPVLKWKPKRRHYQLQKSLVTNNEEDTQGKASVKHENTLLSGSTTTATTVATQKALHVANTPAVQAQAAKKVYEILTQKSVSKSVSIKIGENGEEIPIIAEDDNEVLVNENKLFKNNL